MILYKKNFKEFHLLLLSYLNIFMNLINESTIHLYVVLSLISLSKSNIIFNIILLL